MCVCVFSFGHRRKIDSLLLLQYKYKMSESLDHVFKILLIGDAGVGKSR